MEYPDNEFLQKHVWTQDHYVDLKASPKDIWPWLAQMGNGRAGWYSYDWLDNMGRRSFTTIDPKMTAIKRGQKIPLAVICDFQENKFITFQFGSKITFTFYLQDLNEKTRLWTRLRVPNANRFVKTFLSFSHKIMQDKQFLEIKKRVEG
jgi:hypothetical protein